MSLTSINGIKHGYITPARPGTFFNTTPAPFWGKTNATHRYLKCKIAVANE